MDELIALINGFKPDIVINVALPYQDLTIMDACLASKVDYLDTEYVTIAGVNNRNLHAFRTDINTSFRLSALIPDDFVRISESGLSRADDLRLLRTAGYEGFLMGEQFMKAEQPARALQQLIQELEV